MFLMMVAVRPWKGPSTPLCLNTDFTQPETEVNAAINTHRTLVITGGDLYVALSQVLILADQASLYFPRYRDVWGQRTFVVWISLRPDDLNLYLGLEEINGPFCER